MSIKTPPLGAPVLKVGEAHVKGRWEEGEAVFTIPDGVEGKAELILMTERGEEFLRVEVSGHALPRDLFKVIPTLDMDGEIVELEHGEVFSFRPF